MASTADTNGGKLSFPTQPELYVNQNAEYGAGLVEELGFLSEQIQRNKGLPKEERQFYLRAQKVVFLDILQFRQQYGFLPDGIKVWLSPQTPSFTLPSDTPYDARYNENRMPTSVEIEYKYNNHSGHLGISTGNLLRTVIRESDYKETVRSSKKILDNLLSGLVFGSDGTDYVSPGELIENDIFTINMFNDLVGDLLDNKPYRSTNLRDQQIDSMNNIILRLATRVIATMNTEAGAKFDYSLVDKGRSENGKRLLQVTLPVIKKEKSESSSILLLYVPDNMGNDAYIDFLLRHPSNIPPDQQLRRAAI